MSHRHFTITKNTGFLILREALNKGALFVILALVARWMGKEVLGRYSLALGLAQMFFFGTELGLNTLVIRDVAREKSSAGFYLKNMATLRALLGAATIGLILITAVLMGARGELLVVIGLCAVSYFFANLINVYASIFRAFERMEYEFYFYLLKNALFLPTAIWLMTAGHGLIAVFSVFLVSNIAALVFAHGVFMRLVHPPPHKLDCAFWGRQLRQALPLGASNLFGVAYLKIAPLILFMFRGEGAVGLYNAGFVVVEGMWVAAGCFVASLFPIISSQTRVSPEAVVDEYRRGLRWISLFFIVIAALVIAGANVIVELLYGRAFGEIVPLVRILAVAGFVLAVNTHNVLTIIAVGKQRVLPLITAAALVTGYLLNIELIGPFGYFGAAYALIASEMLVFVLMAVTLKRFFAVGRVSR